MNSKQKGFSALHILLLLVVAGIIGGTGWYVYKVSSEFSKSTDEATKDSNEPIQHSKADANPAKTQEATWKEYANTDYGFKFKYPSTWKLEEQLSNIGRGKLEGTVTVTSSNGTVVEFAPNLGGKGGDCWDNQADARTVRTCSTVDILSLDDFPSGIDERIFYYYEAKVTASEINGGAARYEIGVTDNKYKTPSTGSYLADGFIDIIANSKGNVNIRVSGKNDSDRASSSFLSSTEAKEASTVLKTYGLTSK